MISQAAAAAALVIAGAAAPHLSVGHARAAMPRRLCDHLRDLVLVDEPVLRPNSCSDCAALVRWARDEDTPVASIEVLSRAVS